MPDTDDHDRDGSIENLVDQPVVANTDAVEIGVTREARHAMRARIVGERQDLHVHTPEDIGSQGPQVPMSRGRDLDRVGHWSAVVRRSAQAEAFPQLLIRHSLPILRERKPRQLDIVLVLERLKKLEVLNGNERSLVMAVTLQNDALALKGDLIDRLRQKIANATG
jgi:hypothetical protein